MTPPTYSPWLRAFEALGRFGFGHAKPSGSPGSIGPVGDPSPTDCSNSLDWRAWDKPLELYRTWSPPPDSPWSGYARPTLFAALDARYARPQPWTRIQAATPADPKGARAPLPPKPRLPEACAVVLDLPGPMTVAYAAWLTRRLGMQPVPLFNNWPHPLGIVDMAPVLAGLLYHAPCIDEDRNLRGTTAPPCFLLDRSRLGRGPHPEEFDNRYYHLEADLPSAATLQRHGIHHVLYVSPDTAAQAFNPEMDDLNTTLVEWRKRVGLAVATASTQDLALDTPRDYAPLRRRTAFSTVRDPAFAGFRRAAAGGFGRLVPLPSQGGGGFG